MKKKTIVLVPQVRSLSFIPVSRDKLQYYEDNPELSEAYILSTLTGDDTYSWAELEKLTIYVFPLKGLDVIYNPKQSDAAGWKKVHVHHIAQRNGNYYLVLQKCDNVYGMTGAQLGDISIVLGQFSPYNPNILIARS